MIWLLIFSYFLISFCTICYWITEYYEFQIKYQSQLVNFRNYLETIRDSIGEQTLKNYEDYIINLEKSVNSYKNRKQMTYELSPILIFIAPIILLAMSVKQSAISILNFLRNMYRMYKE